ncbi:replication initiation protein RepC [Cereibacter sphaeroides]|uniref:replication initiation protein RepC n=1 Tax=Cereibacter sphaeroides TaxID=1063 RepID=UPI001EEF6E5B|nr:replication initiation protein RepC [Cereibacter sphaeroides]MCE6967545.1 hypothetical protein [Cereibacter sphaeroides]
MHVAHRREFELRPHLPKGMQRGDVERLLVICAPRLGLTSSQLHVLLVMIHHTRPEDWTSTERDPFCFAAQSAIADDLDLSPRALRTIERQLEDLGLLSRDTGAGGQRGKWGDFALGHNFAPLIERVPDIVALDAQRGVARQRAQILRRQLSALRRQLREAIERLLAAAPKNPMLPALLVAMAALPRRYADLPLGRLEAIRSDLEVLHRKAREALADAEEDTGRSEASHRPHIQDTSHDDFCTCSGSPATTRSGGKPPETTSGVSTPHGAETCIENKDGGYRSPHKPDLLTSFSPRMLYHAASEDFRLYLDGYKCGSLPDESTFVQAAIAILPDLGVNLSAWDEARDSMGDLAAALSVLVIDANRFHPARPIHSPGGALRAFTRKARAGTLNLAGSLIGLVGRSRGRTGGE